MNSDLTIKKYYDKTWIDYSWVWNARNTHALHFGFYDENARTHDVAIANLNRKLADLAEIDATKRVFDAGCGIAGSCIWLASERGAEVVGLTIVESQWKKGLSNVKKHQLSDKIQLHVGDYCHTSFPSESFDVVWAIESQCHAADKADFYKEAYRLLKPGGHLVIADYMRSLRPDFREAESDLRKLLVKPTTKLDFETIDGEVLLANWVLNTAFPDIDTAEEHHAHASQVGFTDIVIQDVSPNVRISLKNVYEQSFKWLELAILLNKVGLVSDVRLHNAFGTICQYKAFQRQYWQYVLISMRKK